MPAFVVTVSATGGSTPIPIDLRRFKSGVGLLVTFNSGASGTVSVECCGDPIQTGLVHWNPHDVLASLTASRNSSLAYPCTAVRLNPASLSGGTVTLAVVEGES